MVDFSKHLGKKKLEKKINPVEIYQSLDRTSVAGPLRPIQEEILLKWFSERREDKDLILKLHTGQGKTLIGLLVLQSKINEHGKPCVYVCPNIYLVNQTCEQAKKFGINYVTIAEDNILPEEFLNGEKILITHIQKLFNGKTIFKLGTSAIKVNSIVLDDSHACIDSIKNSFTIKIKRSHELYNIFLSLFESELREQEEGTYIDLTLGDGTNVLQVPYWAWIDKASQITELLGNYKDQKEILFVWPLIKNYIKDCCCYISSYEIEISPSLNLIHLFGTFHNAVNRIFMSATTQNDSFFIKGLGVTADAVKNPLFSSSELWSGEKMILIPSLIHEELDRNLIITKFSPPNSSRKYGIVSIVNSFKKGELYNTLGAVVSSSEDIFENISSLKRGRFSQTNVIVNRYDGIDLPDDTCRILIIDSKPISEDLSEKYEEQSRDDSDIINIKIAQKIEQGLGRSVRGEKDYSVIILIGEDLINFMNSVKSKNYFSNQTKKQIEIGRNVCLLSRADVRMDESSFNVISKVIKQCIDRDPNWKEYYEMHMNDMDTDEAEFDIVEVLKLEKESEDLYLQTDTDKAVQVMQKIVDQYCKSNSEKGWYLQQMARYKYHLSKSESNKLQKSAFKNNYNLLKPIEGINYSSLDFINENRIKRIKDFIGSFPNHEQLILKLNAILSDFSFGVNADKFEKALQEIGIVLGFLSQRPDKEFRKGPDNLWCIGANDFLMLECKSEVSEDRKEISSKETNQMNKQFTWFRKEYSIASVKGIMVIPIIDVANTAEFLHDVEIMRKGKLKLLKDNISSFVKEFKNYNSSELTDERIQQWIITHKLDVHSLKTFYSEKSRQKR